MDCQDKGLKPERTIGDDANGLVWGHRIVFPGVPYHYDNFHLSRGLMDLRRYFINRLKTAITERGECGVQLQKSSGDERKYQQWIDANDNKSKARYISKTLDTLISWFEHDILNKAGPTKHDRRVIRGERISKPRTHGATQNIGDAYNLRKQTRSGTWVC